MGQHSEFDRLSNGTIIHTLRSVGKTGPVAICCLSDMRIKRVRLPIGDTSASYVTMGLSFIVSEAYGYFGTETQFFSSYALYFTLPSSVS